MLWLHLILLIVAAVLALSALIIAERPNARALIDKLVPFQALIGVALLASGMWLWARFGFVSTFRWLGAAPLFGITLVTMIFSGLALGFLFGMPQIAKWIPGETKAETKAVELSKKIAPIQMVIGAAGLGGALLGLLYALGVLKIGIA